MEFYQEVHSENIAVSSLQELLTVNSLETYCDSITEVSSINGDVGDIYCIWGAFTVQRVELKHGVRFSLLSCPHALAWSITLNTENNMLIIHCTIDKKESDQDFSESIEGFVNDWHNGLSSKLPST
ncbi:MAG: hypothetical protein V3U75_08205 [Methylococcaceae bacterium]